MSDGMRDSKDADMDKLKDMIDREYFWRSSLKRAQPMADVKTAADIKFKDMMDRRECKLGPEVEAADIKFNGISNSILTRGVFKPVDGIPNWDTNSIRDINNVRDINNTVTVGGTLSGLVGRATEAYREPVAFDYTELNMEFVAAMARIGFYARDKYGPLDAPGYREGLPLAGPKSPANHIQDHYRKSVNQEPYEKESVGLEWENNLVAIAYNAMMWYSAIKKARKNAEYLQPLEQVLPRS